MTRPYAARPTATCYLDGKRWYGIKKLRYGQQFGQNIAGGSVEGRDPPTDPRVGMTLSWRWGYDGVEVAGFMGYVSERDVTSYPNTWKLECKDTLWLADQNSSVLQTSPLNSITAKAAVIYLLNNYGGIPTSKIQVSTLPASGAAWVGGEWVLGLLTPVQWGDTDTNSGGTTALQAAALICGALGYWLYCDSGGIIRAKQMEKKPSTVAREVFERAVNLLVQGAPVRKQAYDKVYNQVTVHGANTGIDGAQLVDQRQTTHPLLRSGVVRDWPYSNFLLEYENASDAGAASVSSVATRLINVVSRVPDEETHRAKADPNRKVGDTVGLIDAKVGLSSQKNYFIYAIDRTLDLDTGAFDDALSLDGGTGNTGFTTIPPPDASFSWELEAETLDGTAVVVVSLDASGSTSPTGEIVSSVFSTSTATYGGTPNTFTGVKGQFVFAASASPASVSLTVTDTTAKTGTYAASIDLTGADTAPPLVEVVSGAAGAAWYATPDGGGTWNIETSNGDAISVGTIGAGADDRAAGTAGTYGLVATRGSGGIGLRQTINVLSGASTNLVSAGGAVTSNIWVNEANPARLWWAVGTAVYRSTDGGVTKTAMHAAPASVAWIMEDPSVDNSVFLLAGSSMYNATDPTVGWALLYSGPVGSTARQFVRSRDGQVTWICFTGAPAGEALQRVETGALADWTATDCRTLALDRNASSLVATVYGITGDDPAQIWSFDGLTGLSSHQLASTFPSGATVQHMIQSRKFDVIYTADFDSIASGQGAFRKLFADMDKLLLWKALTSGQQAHMLGLGGSVSAPATILLLPAGETGAADMLFILDGSTGVWTSKALPAASKSDWQWIEANPFDTKKLLLFRYTGSGDNALYYSADFGDTWTTVFTNLTTDDDTTGKLVQWSLSFGSEWIMSRSFSSSQRRLLRGTDATYAETTLATGDEIFMGAGLNGDAVWSDSGNVVYYTDSGGTTSAGVTSTGLGFGFTYPLRGTRKMVHARTASEHEIAVTNDYQSTAFADIATSGARSFVGVLANETLICGGRADGIQEVADAWGAQIVTLAAFAGMGIGAVATDKQTQTVAAAIYGPGNPATLQPAVRGAAGGWSLIARPPTAGNLANRIEVLTR